MFELRCFIDDKKLAQVLRALDGLVYEPKTVPVRDAVAKNGKVVSAAKPKGSAVEALLEWAKHRRSDFNTRDALNYLESRGHHKSTTNYCLDRLMEKKIVKRIKVGSSNSPAIWRLVTGA